MQSLRSGGPYEPDLDPGKFSSAGYSESDAVFSDPAYNTDRPSPPRPLSPPSRLHFATVRPDELNEPGSPIPFAALIFDPKAERHDPKYVPSEDRRPRLSDDDKVAEVLDALHKVDPRFSLSSFLTTLFTSDDQRITLYANKFLSDDGAISLLNIWDARLTGERSLKLGSWAIYKSAAIVPTTRLSSRTSPIVRLSREKRTVFAFRRTK